MSAKKGVKRSSAKRKEAKEKEVSPLANVPSAKTIGDTSKKDISIIKLINYNLLFFIPLLIALIFLYKIGERAADYFQASPGVVVRILMIPVIFAIFYLIIPFIRHREKVAGIRYSIIAFLIVAVGITLPNAIKNHDYSMFFNMFIYVASYILLTFFFCPEVLGMERTISDWFKHRKQLNIIAIYLSIVMFFIIGFGGLYYDIYKDPVNPEAFMFSHAENPSMMTFIYYSMVSYTTTGYGEILPVSPAARLVFFMEALIGLVLNVLFIAILLMFISNAQFLSQQEEKRMIKDVAKEEKKLKREEKAIKKEVKKIEDELEVAERELPLFEKLFGRFFGK